MLTSVQWYVDASHGADFARPHATTVNHNVSLDGTDLIARVRCPLDACHTTIGLIDCCDAYAFLDQCSAVSRTLGKGERNVGRVGLTVCRQVNSTHHTVNVQVRIHGQCLFRTDRMCFNVKSAGQTRLTVNFFFPCLGEGNGHAAVCFHARGDAGFFLKLHVQIS